MQISLSAFTGIWAKVFPTKRFWAPTLQRSRRPTRTRRCLTLELLEDRTTPSLIATQVLPLIVPPPVIQVPPLIAPAPTVDTVAVVAPSLSDSSPTPQQITLTDTISGVRHGRDRQLFSGRRRRG